MEAKSTERKLKIMSFNVQGLRNSKKRNALFRLFKKNKYDIVAIQEAYLVNEDMTLIDREWGNPYHLSEGTKRSKGVLTLFGSGFKFEDIVKVYMDDRVIISKVHFDDNVINIVNIYGPCGDREKIFFYNNLVKTIDCHVNNDIDNLIVLGDTNVVRCNSKDVIVGLKHANNSVTEFNKFINNFELHDVWRDQNQNQREYTWCRKNSRASTFIARRLDYIFVNSNLFAYCQDANIYGLGFSDHRAVTLVFNFATFKRGPSNFKLNVELLKDINFINLAKQEIEEVRKKSTELDPHLLWELVKIKLKTVAISYGKRKAQENRINKKSLIENLAACETLLASQPNDITLQAKMTNLKSKLEIFLLKETEGARIRAGIKWAEKGEHSNKFFLNIGAQRARNDTIFRMSNKDNTTVKDNDGILDLLSCHFENIYLQPSNPQQDSVDDMFCIPDENSQLGDEEAELLERTVTEAELHSALASMKNGSSPGMDGIPVEIYKVMWCNIKDLLLKNIKYSFEVEELSFSQTHGVIKLLHKGKGQDREKVANWRPITLLNTDYKIVAKLIARRMNTVLEKMIDPNQYAFIKGRNAGEMIREIDDIIELEKIKGKKSILLSIDYAKAFDTLSTNAIMKAMRLYGFKSNFLKWIQILLKERKSSVKNNNFISRFFDMERGVRQGCPLSPLLFICTVELLARNIRNDKNIKGVMISKNHRPLKIKFFADDTTLFLRDQMDFREVLSKIKLFAIFSGLELNKGKSMAMILDKNNGNVKEMFGIKIVDKLKILGIHFSNKSQTCEIKDNYESKIEHLESLCKIWSRRNLSIIVKIVLIKTFGISLFTHVINSIGIDEERIKKINQILFKFIWNKSSTNKKTIEKVKRSILCSNKKEGGLGMTDLKLFQTGFYLKWAELLLDSNNQEWKTTAMKFFLPVGGLLVFKSNITNEEFKGMSQIKSLFWKRVLGTWLTHNSNRRIEECNIKPDSVLFNNTNFRYKNKTLFIPQLIQRNINTVEDVTREGRILSLQEVERKYGTYPGLFLDYNVIFNALHPHTQQIVDNQNKPREEGFLFQNKKVGKLGRKTLVKMIKTKQRPNIEQTWTNEFPINFEKDRWLIPFNVTKEVRLHILQWKICHKIYPTAIILTKMGHRNTDLCQHCGVRETLGHFFFECIATKIIWHEIEKLIAIDTGKRITLNTATALLGYIPDQPVSKKEWKFINLTILIGKLAISKLKYGPQRNPIEILESEIRMRNI